jgi:hypothetical protein
MRVLLRHGKAVVEFSMGSLKKSWFSGNTEFLYLPEARYICRRFCCGAKGQASLRTLSVCASVHVGPRAEGRPSRTVQRIGERNFAAKTTRRHFQATPELELQPHAASGRTRPCAAVRHDTHDEYVCCCSGQRSCGGLRHSSLQECDDVHACKQQSSARQGERPVGVHREPQDGAIRFATACNC